MLFRSTSRPLGEPTLNGSEGRADKGKDRDIREGFETEDPVRADIPSVREGSLGTLDDEGGPQSWWGPEGFTTTVHKLDLRPGGNSNMP